MYGHLGGPVERGQLDHGLCLDLRHARRKSAIGNRPSPLESRCVNRGRSVWMEREWSPNDKQAGGAFVVVRDRESLLQGEGKQPRRVVSQIN